MVEPTIRIIVRDDKGDLIDSKPDYKTSEFGGVFPSIGDMILEPGVREGLDRTVHANRHFLTVVGRVFYPSERGRCVALIVEERTPTKKEQALLPIG